MTVFDAAFIATVVEVECVQWVDPLTDIILHVSTREYNVHTTLQSGYSFSSRITLLLVS